MKGFLWSLLGFFLGLIVTVGAIFICVKVIPTNMLLGTFGVKTEEYVSEKVSSKSVVDALLGLNEYTLNDIPVLKDVITDFAEQEELSDFIEVDEKKLGKLKIGDLSSGIGDCFNIKAVDDAYLIDVMDETGNEDIYDILREGTGKATNAEIKVVDLQDFKITRVKLSTVLSEEQASSNPLLAVLYADEEVTIGNLSQKVNDVRLDEIYNIPCFTTDMQDARDKNLKYSCDPDDETYTQDASGEYYINDDVKVWFFIFYEVDKTAGGTDGIDGSGNAIAYKATKSTFGQMESKGGEVGVVDGINEKVSSATVKQLVDTGVLDGTNFAAGIMNRTLQAVLEGAS